MSGPNGDLNISVNDGIIEDEDEFNEEEYAAIDSMLDQISSCLDDIEERNDALNGKLQELLESNRAARRDFRQQSQHRHHHDPEEEQNQHRHHHDPEEEQNQHRHHHDPEEEQSQHRHPPPDEERSGAEEQPGPPLSESSSD